MTESVSISGYPYKFNPPLHPSLQFVNPTIGLHGALRTAVDPMVYDEKVSTYESTAGAVGGKFNSLRLGRMTMGDSALTFATQQSGQRFGFRFLYNPTEVTGSQNVGTDFIPDPADSIMFVLQDGLEVLSFELLLNRMPEVQGGAKAGDYGHAITEDEFVQLKERGTHYDLEYLYRLCNGLHDTQARTQTGDIGILLPNPVELYMGNLKSRGAVITISATDKVFSWNMVPMITYVQIQFARYLTMDDTGIEKLKSTGVTVQGTGGGDSSSSSSSSSSSGSSGGAGVLAPQRVFELAKGVGCTDAQATTATQIAWAESTYDSKAHNAVPPDNSYGLWQINMISGANTHSGLNIGTTKNEELFDPAINAKAMWRLSNSGKTWTPWTTYTSGKYKEAPTW